MSKKSSRAQKREYSPVSTFKPNEKLPEDASLMDKAKAAAKRADVKAKSAVLRGAQGENKEKFPEDLQKSIDQLNKKKTRASKTISKPDFLDVDGDGDKKESMKKAAQDKK